MAQSSYSQQTPESSASPRSEIASSSEGNLETIGHGEGTRLGARTGAEASRRVRSRATKRTATARTRATSGHVTSRRMSTQNRPRYASKRNESTSISREQILILAGAALLVIVLAAILFSRACSSTQTPGQTTTPTEQTTTSTQTDGGAEETTPEPSAIQAPANMVGNIQDVTFYIQEGTSGYVLMAQGRDTGDAIEVLTLSGQPVSLLVHNSSLYIPENHESSWDVIEFEWGAERESSVYTSGEGAIREAGIAGSTLYVGLASEEDLEFSL